MSRRTLALAAVAMLSAACGGTSPQVHAPRAEVTRPSVRGDRAGWPIQEPVSVAPPAIRPSDTPMDRADKLGQFMESRWPRIHLRPDANALGTIAAFAISIDYDRYAGDDSAWEASIHEVAGDLREASVELLQLAARYFPKLRYATVWEDQALIFFWSKRQIRQMGPAWLYREFDAFQELTRLAEVQPPLLEYAKQHELPEAPVSIVG